MSSGRPFNKEAATGASRASRVSQAALTAWPFKSEPLLAAVAEVLGTLSVLVVITRRRETFTPSERAATPSILVCRPCPISVPPWFTWMLPSV